LAGKRIPDVSMEMTMTPQTTPSTWALRIHSVCDWIWWAMVMNALWLLFTAAGGIVLGAAPATVAATELTRRRLRDEKTSTLREFAAAWRREFWRANGILAAPLLVSTLLALQLISVVTSDTLTTPLGITVAVAMAIALVITTLIAPLYAHYELPLSAYLPTASRWMTRNIAHALLLCVAATGVTSASLALPGLIPFVSIGAWLSISTALCVGFFTANDRMLRDEKAPPTPVGPSAELTAALSGRSRRDV
jgi:uncharacterized membrane protein YesL